MVKDDPKGLICAVVEIQGILAQNLGRRTLKCDNFQWENHLWKPTKLNPKGQTSGISRNIPEN